MIRRIEAPERPWGRDDLDYVREGRAGALFRVSVLDLMNLPRDDSGRVDFGQDFFKILTGLRHVAPIQPEISKKGKDGACPEDGRHGRFPSEEQEKSWKPGGSLLNILPFQKI